MKRMVSALASGTLLATLAMLLLATLVTLLTGGQVFGAGGMVKSPTGAAPDRYVYYRGTEELAKDEIRVIACGTGLPAARRSQAATCFLTEVDSDAYDWGLGIGLRFMY